MYQVKGLTRYFESKRRKVFALKDITIDFPSKGFVVIKGESGSGKTTLLNLLSGLDKPTGGTILYDGIDLSHKSGYELSKYRNSLFSVIFQDINLIESFNVKDNILLSLILQNRQVDLVRLEEILTMLEISDLVDALPYQLSGGEKQRVALARALMKECEVIFADEPTSSLDEKNAFIIMKALKEISKNKLVIFISHDDDLSNQYGDYYLELENGAVKTTNLETLHELKKREIKASASKLPMKYAFKMGLKDLFRKRLKLFFTVISLIFAFTLAILAILLANFDESVSLEKSMLQEKEYYASIIKEKAYDESLIVPENDYFSDFEINLINQKIGNDANVVLYSDALYGTTMNEGKRINGTKFSGALVLDIDDLQKYHMAITGELPKDENEVALTSYNAEILGINEQNYSTYSLVMGLESLSISGIICTNYIDISSLNGSSANDSQLQYGMHNSIFLSQTGFDKAINELREYKEESNGEFEGGYKCVITSKPITEVSDLIDSLNSNPDFVYNYYNRLSGAAHQTAIFVEYFDDLFLFGSLAFILLGIILLISYIYGNIVADAKYIRILKSLGVSNKDLYKVYFFPNCLTTVFCFIVSFAIFIVLSNLINSYLRDEINVVIPLLNVDFLLTLLALFGVLVISILTTFISLSRYIMSNKIVYL